MPKSAKIIFCCYLLLHCHIILLIGQIQLKFEHLTTADGLPSNMNYHIFQDHLGFLWFSNQFGLVRYDGYQCLTFVPDSTNPYSISTAHVNQVCEDSRGNLWISSEFSGINKFERRTGRFSHFIHDPHKQTSLSSDSIFRCIIDHSDILWIIHANGMLDRLDTRTGTIIRNPHLPESNPYTSSYGITRYGQNLNFIVATEDSKGNLWFGTYSGIFCYERKGNVYIQYIHDSKNPNSLSCDTVSGIYEGKDGLIWISTWGGGLNCFHPDSHSFTSYKHLINNKNSISNNHCFYLYGDKSHRLWISVRRGLDLFDPENRTFKNFKHNPNDPGSLNKNTVNRAVFALPVYEEPSGLVWINIGGNGLYNLSYDIYDPQKDCFYHLEENRDDPTGIRGTYSLYFFVDNADNIWISGYERGLNKLNPYIQQFTNYMHQPNINNTIRDNYITSILESKSDPGSIWIGTRNGLDKYNINTGELKHFEADPHNPKSIMITSIYSLYEDAHQGLLWIGTSLGYCCYDIKRNKFEYYYKDPNIGSPQGPSTIWTICEDNKGLTWLGDIYYGLFACDSKTRKLVAHYKHSKGKPASLSSDILRCVFYDSRNTLWIASDNGISRFNYETKSFTNYLEGVDIFVIKEDIDGNFWLGTSQNGLGLFNRQTGETNFYTTYNGLCNNRIFSIVEDRFGNLWLGTESGISRFNISARSFENFYKDDGLPTQMFQWNAAGISNGQLWMATADKGIVAFYPDRLMNNTVPPKIVINSIRLSNKLITASDHSPLKEDINICREIHLKHTQHDITFECTALHFGIPQKNQYAFWLENYDEGWHNAGKNRIASYTNLDPGNYIFHAKASNCDNVWNEEGISLRIIISPPWWQTWWAYLLYTLLTGSIIFVIWKEQLRRVYLKHELQMKEFEADKLHELDHMKSGFFANISHELRTPLTLIIGPTEQLISDEKDKKRKDVLQLVLQNGRKLLHLINQLLDFSKLEAGRMKLTAKEMDIVPLLKGMVYSFSSMADRKKLCLSFKTDCEKINVYIDRDKLEIIISNLLSNAFKYTPEGGNIGVELSVFPFESTQGNHVNSPGELAQIHVSDTGRGIAPEHLNRVFDRYYRVEEKEGNTGTGIGLALTKEMVELHHGTVSVESELGKGSSFIVCLPLGRDHLRNDEIISQQEQNLHPEIFIEKESVSEKTFPSGAYSKSEQKVTKQIRQETPRLLIVEDIEDVRNYIRGFLDNDYQIKEAVDGQDGFEKAVESIPDLIISDVMMPKMDGFALCEKLKTDERTSHIPIILLTARASEASKLEGLETGADAYIVKPFNTQEVRIRVRKLIEQRRKLRERFSRDITLSPKEITVTSIDERFLNRVVEVIEKHMSETDFDVNSFGKEVGMSHSQLYRKVQALTNQSPVELICSIRLKRAASLLKQKYGSISEIAYETGFSTPGYFTKCFQKQFGKSPSEFISGE